MIGDRPQRPGPTSGPREDSESQYEDDRLDPHANPVDRDREGERDSTEGQRDHVERHRTQRNAIVPGANEIVLGEELFKLGHFLLVQLIRHLVALWGRGGATARTRRRHR